MAGSRRNKAAAVVVDAAQETKETVAELRDEAIAVVASDRDNALTKVTDVAEITKHEIEAIRGPVRSRVASPRLPSRLQFPLMAVLSFAMSSLGYSLLSERTDGELASVTKSLDTWGELGTMVGWRILELALAWFGGYDSLDVAALSILSHGPSLYLIRYFYNKSTVAVLSALTIDTLSALIPLQLLRPLSPAHSGATTIPNREVLADVPVQALTTLLGAAIYGVSLVTAFRTFLPNYLVVYFDGIATLQPAYEASYLHLIPVILTLGFAARSFIFTPYAAVPDVAPEDAQLAEFDPVKSTLKDTVAYNLWGYTSKAKVAISRTAALAAATGINTYLHTAMTLAGVESYGAFVYAVVWATAALVTGTALGLVGDV